MPAVDPEQWNGNGDRCPADRRRLCDGTVPFCSPTARLALAHRQTGRQGRSRYLRPTPAQCFQGTGQARGRPCASVRSERNRHTAETRQAAITAIDNGRWKARWPNTAKPR